MLGWRAKHFNVFFCSCQYAVDLLEKIVKRVAGNAVHPDAQTNVILIWCSYPFFDCFKCMTGNFHFCRSWSYTDNRNAIGACPTSTDGQSYYTYRAQLSIAFYFIIGIHYIMMMLWDLSLAATNVCVIDHHWSCLFFIWEIGALCINYVHHLLLYLRQPLWWHYEIYNSHGYKCMCFSSSLGLNIFCFGKCPLISP